MTDPTIEPDVYARALHKGVCEGLRVAFQSVPATPREIGGCEQGNGASADVETSVNYVDTDE